MNSDDLISSIKKLRVTSITSMLGEILDDIEEKMAEGVSHEGIVQALNSAGLKININTFRTALYRNRRLRASRLADKMRAEAENKPEPLEESLPKSAPIPEPDVPQEAVKPPTYKESLDQIGAKYVNRNSR